MSVARFPIFQHFSTVCCIYSQHSIVNKAVQTFSGTFVFPRSVWRCILIFVPRFLKPVEDWRKFPCSYIAGSPLDNFWRLLAKVWREMSPLKVHDISLHVFVWMECRNDLPVSYTLFSLAGILRYFKASSSWIETVQPEFTVSSKDGSCVEVQRRDEPYSD